MKTDSNKKIFSALFIALAGALWGTIGISSTYLSNAGFSVLQTTCLRSVITVIILGGCIIIQNPKLFKTRMKDLWLFAGMGIVSFVLFNLAYFTSMRLNKSLSTACILLYTAPVFVMLLSSVLFHEKTTRKKLLALGLAIGGCVLVSGLGGNVTGTGFLFGLASGLGYALYSIFSIFALKTNNFFTAIFYAFLFASLGTVPFANWIDVFELTIKNPPSLIYLFVISVFSTILPYIFYTMGLRHIEASKASIIACVEPLVATLVGLLVFGQTLSFFSFVGMAMILLAVILLNVQFSNKGWN